MKLKFTKTAKIYKVLVKFNKIIKTIYSERILRISVIGASVLNEVPEK